VIAAAKVKGDTPAPAAKAEAPAAAAPAGARNEERVRMTRLRKTIAKRLKGAQEEAALLTTFNDVDMTAVIEARTKYKELFAKKHDIKLGFMGFFAKAAHLALKDVPSVNGQIDGDEIVYHDYVDISVAVSAPNGLVVPVVRDVDKKSFAQIEKDIANFGKAARDGTLTMADMTGGTFTISNGGVFGSLMSTPIINPPQSAVLGLHRIEDRAVVVNGEIVVRPMMYIALSYDHRLIDGREAVTALKIIKDAIEDPTRMLIDL
jgi:2-oxoglutarate dehydrogenase E2 component (dihydrolipoamide succinyltransferase)